MECVYTKSQISISKVYFQLISELVVPLVMDQANGSNNVFIHSVYVGLINILQLVYLTGYLRQKHNNK